MIDSWLRELASPFTGEELFDHISDVVYFIKNECGEYLIVNKTLVERCAVKSKAELLGKTAAEVLRPPLGDRFAAQDQQLLKTGTPMLSQLELHLYPNGNVGWCLTTKLPLRNRRGKIIGLVGVSQDLRIPDTATDEYRQLAAAIEYAEARLSSPPSVPKLAEVAKMSVTNSIDECGSRSDWSRTMVGEDSLDAAQRMLQSTELPIATIALQTGYFDQSAFTRQFRRATGLSPSQFREARRWPKTSSK